MKTKHARIGMAAASAAALLAVAGCQGSGTDGKAADKAPKFQSKATAIKALTAAYEKTAEAKSTEVELVMTMPSQLDGGGEVRMAGQMGWDPAAVNMKVWSDVSGGDLSSAEPTTMLMQDDVLYMDAPAAARAEMDGKRWMKIDLGAMADKIAEEGGDPALQKQLTGGLDSMNQQNPAEQIALLLESPNLKHLGSQTLDGEKTQHYKGRLTVKEMLGADDSLDVLDKKDRDELLENIEKGGIEGYDTELWVNEDGYPAKLDMAIKTAQGTMQMTETFTHYSAEQPEIQVPSASETFDMMKMLDELASMGMEDGGLEG